MRFQIYKVGNLEIRTTQEPFGDETIGAVFSVRNRNGCNEGSTGKRVRIQGDGDFTKITEYVEAAFESDSVEHIQCQYYTVLETVSGNKVLTERLRDGRVTWEEDPEGLEDRNSLAKVTRTFTCPSGGISAEAIARYRAGAAEGAPAEASYTSPAVCRQYAQDT